MNIRSFLFKNGIIFNKQELSEMVGRMKVERYGVGEMGKRIR